MEIPDEYYIAPLWHLADVLALQDAAALIAGYNPSEVALSQGDTNYQKNYPDMYIAESALQNAIQFEILQAEVQYIYHDNDGYFNKSDDIDMMKTKVKVDDIRAWLICRGINTGFFFNKANETPEYLDGELC